MGEEAPLFSLAQQSPASSVSDGLLRERSYWSNRTVGVPLFPSVESHRPESVQGVNAFFVSGEEEVCADFPCGTGMFLFSILSPLPFFLFSVFFLSHCCFRSRGSNL